MIATSKAPWWRSSTAPPTMVLPWARPRVRVKSMGRMLAGQGADEAHEEQRQHRLHAERHALVERGCRSAGSALPPPARRGRRGGSRSGLAPRAVRMGGRVRDRQIDHSLRLLDSRTTEGRARPWPRRRGRGRTRPCRDLHKRDHHADEEDLGHRPGLEELGVRKARAAPGAAGGRSGGEERVGERAAGSPAGHDEQRGGDGERRHEAAREGERRLDDRGGVVKPGDRRARGRGRRSPRSSG